MNKFQSYIIGVGVVMALVLAGAWFLGGAEHFRTIGTFFLGWITGAISMFLKAKLVYKA